MLENAVIYSLTLIMEFGREQGARAGARPLEILNRRVEKLGKTSERRLPQISFRKGLGFLVKNVNVATKQTQEEVNKAMHAAGGGMTSRDWFPAMLALSVVVSDDYKQELLPDVDKAIVLKALQRSTEVLMVLKKESLTETQLNQLDGDIRK